MIRFPGLPGGYVIFADDIRQEIDGKVTIVGMYGNELSVSGTGGPYALAQLCVVINFRCDPDEIPEQVSLKAILIATEETVIWECHFPMAEQVNAIGPPPKRDPNSQLYAEWRTLARFVPFVITEDCKVSVRAYAGEDEIKLGSLRIKINTDVPERS